MKRRWVEQAARAVRKQTRCSLFSWMVSAQLHPNSVSLRVGRVGRAVGRGEGKELDRGNVGMGEEGEVGDKAWEEGEGVMDDEEMGEEGELGRGTSGVEVLRRPRMFSLKITSREKMYFPDRVRIHQPMRFSS